MACFIPNDTSQFSSIFDTVSNILEIGSLRIREDGIYISGLDSSHVSLINVELNKDDFKIYNYLEDIDIGINFKDFVKIIKSGISNEDVQIICNNSDNLNVIFKGYGLNKKYSLKILNVDNEDIAISDQDYHLELEIKSKLFSNIVNSILITESDSMKFNIYDNKLRIQSFVDHSDIDIELTKQPMVRKKIKIKKCNNKLESNTIIEKEYELYSCEGKFNTNISINYIKLISKAFNICQKIMCNLSPNSPLRIDFMITDNGSMIQYYVSPKIED